MRKIARSLAISIAAIVATNVVASDDFRVVVPLYGKTAVIAGLELRGSVLPAGVVGDDYVGFDFNTVLQVTSGKPVDAAAVTWRASGVLPAGLTLSSTGVLTGVPTADAVDSGPFSVEATYEGKTATQLYKVLVTGTEVIDPDEPFVPPSTGGQGTVSDGAAQLTVKPTKISYGLVSRQLPTAPIKVAISNTGTKPAPLSVGQPANTEFKVKHDCPAELPVGAACEASVVFTPQTQSEQKSFFDVWLGRQPVSVTLIGSGRDSSATLTHLPKKGGGQDFGIVAAGQFVARQTVIKNTSKLYALGIFDAKMAPGYSASVQFALENEACPQVLQVGESCTITGRYAPTAEGSHSSYGRLTMNVSSNRRDFSMYGRAAGSLKITRLSHAGAHLPGGQELYVQGTGILPDAKVFFGSTEVPVRWASTGIIYAKVPEVFEPENTYVTVLNPDGAEASAPTAFKRARSFAEYSVKGPIEFGKQALNVPSQWKYITVTNRSSFSSDQLELNDIQVAGPYQLDPAAGYCQPGRKLGSGGGSCTVRIRFVPTEAGDMPGELTVFGNGEPTTIALIGLGLAWDGTPSGSGTANTDLPYGTVMSGNEPVGGAAQTKFVDIYFRNTNPGAQLNAFFALANGSGFKFYNIMKTAGTSGSSLGCLPTTGAKLSTICRADVGSGSQPHLWVRLQATSAAGVGSHYDELVVMNAAQEEQFRIPLWLDVVYDVSVGTFADSKFTTPIGAVSAERVQLATEKYTDVYVGNLGTQGMLRTESVSLVDSNSPDIYLKGDSLYRVGATHTSVGSCGRVVSATEMTGCLSDDINGGYYPHQRVRVYYKPMSAGARTAKLRIAHRGQGDNPFELPVTISPADFAAMFSGVPAASGWGEVPTFRLPANYDVDSTYVSKNFSLYLNNTDGQLMKGYYQLTGPGGPDYFSMTVGATGADGSAMAGCSMKSKYDSALCATSSAYPHYHARFTLDSRLGAGRHEWKLTYFDPSMQEMASVPVAIDIVNDALPRLSSTHLGLEPFPDDTVDFGEAPGPTVPGQVMAQIVKPIFIRNEGTIGKLKVETVAIEGGDGAFVIKDLMLVLSEGASQGGSCNSVRYDAYSIKGCVTYEPTQYPTGTFRHLRFSVGYTPNTVGTQTATLLIWHNSKVVPNPMRVALKATAVAPRIAGEPSSTPGYTAAPTGQFAALSSAGGTRDLILYVRNGEPNGALYVEEANVEGDYFTFNGSVQKSNQTGGYGTCAATLSGDRIWTTACLADRISAGPLNHARFLVRCTLPSTLPKGTYTGTLRVKTQGAEHRIPLSCSKT